MFSPCSLLVVGWFQPLLFLNIVGFYSKDNQNTVSHSNTDCKLKKRIAHTQGATILSALRLKLSAKATTLLIVPLLVSRHHCAMAIKTPWFPLKVSFAYTQSPLLRLSLQPKQAGVKMAKYSSGERHFFCDTSTTLPTSLMWGFTGLWWFQSQSQSTTQQWWCQHW